MPNNKTGEQEKRSQQKEILFSINIMKISPFVALILCTQSTIYPQHTMVESIKRFVFIVIQKNQLKNETRHAQYSK